MNRILVIDDDIELCELLNDYLSGEGFSVATVNNGRKGAELALAADYVLVVLDVMLPEMNGFDVLRKIRENSKVPVIMLTARGDDIDRIVGLELGADDYLPKPFNPRELVARIRAIQRRVEAAEVSPSHPKTAELKVGDLVLCSSNRTVKRGAENIELTSVEFNLWKFCYLRRERSSAGTIWSKKCWEGVYLPTIAVSMFMSVLYARNSVTLTAIWSGSEPFVASATFTLWQKAKPDAQSVSEVFSYFLLILLLVSTAVIALTYLRDQEFPPWPTRILPAKR